MKLPLGKISLVFLFMILAVNLLTGQVPFHRADHQKVVPNGDGSTSVVPDDDAAKVGPAVVTGNGINYNGGPVLKGNPVPIYIIWYGNWNGSGSNTQTTVNTVEQWLNTVGNTPYEHINTLYGDTPAMSAATSTLAGQSLIPARKVPG